MRKLFALAALLVAYYPFSMAKDEKRRLNKFEVECRAYTTHLPTGASIDFDRKELDRLLLGIEYIAEKSWFSSNRQDARRLVNLYYNRFPASTTSTRTAA